MRAALFVALGLIVLPLPAAAQEAPPAAVPASPGPAALDEKAKAEWGVLVAGLRDAELEAALARIAILEAKLAAVEQMQLKGAMERRQQVSQRMTDWQKARDAGSACGLNAAGDWIRPDGKPCSEETK